MSIRVHGASRTIEGLTILDDVAFAARSGAVTALLGPNGAGKSTLLRALVGLERLDAGEIRVEGSLGALLSPDAVHPRRTARDHLRVLARAASLEASRVDAVLELVGLTPAADLPARRLSLGMRQRLGLATALLPDPDVLVLDEPHNGLDAHAIRWLREALRALADDGRTVLLSSHLLGEVAAVADRVVVLDAGRVVADEEALTFAARASVEDRYLALVGTSA